MITYFDRQIGGLVAELDRLGILDNTLIVITSDNGPASNSCSSSEWFDSARPFVAARGGVSRRSAKGASASPSSWLGATDCVRASATGSVIFPTLCLRFAILPASARLGPTVFRSGRFSTAAGTRCGSTSTFIGSFPEATDGWLCVGGDWKGLLRRVKAGNGQMELSTWPTTRARHTTWLPNILRSWSACGRMSLVARGARESQIPHADRKSKSDENE